MLSMANKLRILIGLMVFGGCLLFAADAGRSAIDSLNELQRLARSGKLSFEELRTVNEAIARTRESMRKKSRTELEEDCIEDLKRVVTQKYESDKSNRIALMELVRFLLYVGDVEKAQEYFSSSKPVSKDDMQWRMLGMQIYLQLGDYAKAGYFVRQLDDLLSKKNPLSVSTPVAVNDVTGYRLYTPRGDKPVKPGEMLTLYIEISGAKFSQNSNGAKCSIDFSIELRDDLQNIIDRNDSYGRYDPVYAGKVNDLHATIYYRVPANLDSGNYVLMIKCKDNFDAVAQAQVFYSFNVGGGVRVSSGLEQKKRQARAELLKRKIQKSSVDDLIGSLGGLDDEFDSDLDLLGGKKDKDGKDTKKDVDKSFMERGLDMQLDRAKRMGDLLNK